MHAGITLASMKKHALRDRRRSGMLVFTDP